MKLLKIITVFFALVGVLSLMAVVMLDITVQPSNVDVVKRALAEGTYSSEELSIAGAMGRLDFVSLMLGMVGIGVGFFALVSYVSIRSESIFEAKKLIEEELKPNLEALAEKTARNYVRYYMQTKFGESSPSLDIPEEPASDQIEEEEQL